jgi:glycosyltransferase involved in cell wall biosynthesis
LVIAYEGTMHTERNSGVPRRTYRRLVARLADAIACNGSLCKEYCETVLGVPRSRIVTGAMAADNDALAGRCATITPEINNQKAGALGLVHPVFLYVGRLIRLKGLRELLQAWLRFQHAAGPKGTLLLVGDGPERGNLESTVRELQLSNVLFAGAVSYEDTALYYSLADVFVMPSLEDKWSLVVPEAMTCGLPVLCSIYNGCWPELVREGENGWVFDAQKPEDLARLFSVCLRERERLPLMGLASRRIVKAFSPRIAAEAVLEACRIAVTAKTGRRTP